MFPDFSDFRKFGGIRDVINSLSDDDCPDLRKEILIASRWSPRSFEGKSVFYNTRIVFLNPDGITFRTYSDISLLHDYECWVKNYESVSLHVQEHAARHSFFNIYKQIYNYNYIFIFFYDGKEIDGTLVFDEQLGLILGTTDEKKADHLRINSEFDVLGAGQNIDKCVGEKAKYITRPVYDKNKRQYITKYMKEVIFAEDLSCEEGGCLRVIAPDGFRKSSPIVPKRLFVKCDDDDIKVGMAFPQMKRYLNFVKRFLTETYFRNIT